MDEEILGGEEDFEEIVNGNRQNYLDSPQSQDDKFFNQIVQALQ